MSFSFTADMHDMFFFRERIAPRSTKVVKECLGALKSLCFLLFCIFAVDVLIMLLCAVSHAFGNMLVE